MTLTAVPRSLMSPGGTARSGAALAITAMMCVQIGLAVSVGLVDRIGASGAAWIRLAWAGIILFVVVRPRRSDFRGGGLMPAVALGVVTGTMALLFMSAVARLPLGTASALEFLGPLAVAVARGRTRRWPLIAAAGVLLLTAPWHGGADPVGVAYALGAAVCWAAYILLTQHVGDESSGIRGLAVSMPVAGLVATAAVAVVPGMPVFSRLTPGIVVFGLFLAVLLPVIPFVLEFLALRRLTTAAFGTLMSLEPAIAVLVGLVLLHQVPDLAAVAGIALVVAAGIGAERSGARAVAPVGPGTA